MKLDITPKQGLAVRKHAAPLLRSFGVRDIGDLEAHLLDWNTLNERSKEVLKANRGIISRIETAADDADLDSMREASDALLEVYDEIEFEKDARNELGGRSPRSQGGSPKRPGVGETRVSNGGARDVEAETAFALKPEQRLADFVRERGGDDEFDGLSAGKYLRSMIVGARTDAERRALSEGSDSAGGFSVPDLLSARLIDRVRNRMVTIRAGAQTVPLGSDVNYVARVLTDAVPAWRSENGAVAESDPTFGRVELTPRSLAVLVKVSRELLEDSLNLEVQLPEILTKAMAIEIDRVALFGSGTAPEPEGIANNSSIETVAHGATLTSYAPLISARQKIMLNNFGGDEIAFIMNPVEDNTLAGLTDSTGQPLMRPRVLENTPMFTTTNVPKGSTVSPEDGTMIAGVFPHLLIGLRSSIRVEVLKERFADNLQFGLLCHVRVDVAVEHPGGFCAITGVAS